MSIAGGVLLSTVVSFYFTPPVYALIHRRVAKAAPVKLVEPARTLPQVPALAAE